MTATVAVSFYVLLGACLACTLLGFAFGWLGHGGAYFEDPRPRQVLTPPERSPLPRAGYLTGDPFPTTPLDLWSPHAAQLERTEREIRQLTADARDRYGWEL